MSSNGIYVCLIYVCPCGQSALNDISFCLPWCEVFYTLSHFKYYAVNRLFRKNERGPKTLSGEKKKFKQVTLQIF